MKSLSRKRQERPALAPLEMVLALPLLVLLMAFIYTIAKVGIDKARASAQARREAWQRPVRNGLREGQQLPSPPGAFTVLPEKQELRGLVDKNISRSTSIWPVTNASVQTKGKVKVLLDPLDHVSAPYGKRQPFTPDTKAFRLLTAVGKDVGNLASQLGQLGGIGNDLSSHKDNASAELPNIRDKLSEIDNNSDELLEKRQEMVKEIADLRKSKDPDREKKIKEKEEEIRNIDKGLEDRKKAADEVNKLP